MPKLLLALSDDKLRTIYANKLGKYFSVDSARHGMAALRTIRLSPPHLILCQDQLPYLSGFALLRYVRSSPGPLASVPFIFLSHSHPSPDALSLGANEWINLSKVELEHLTNRALHHLSRHYRVSDLIN